MEAESDQKHGEEEVFDFDQDEGELMWNAGGTP